jgi:hypothetical protein
MGGVVRHELTRERSDISWSIREEDEEEVLVSSVTIWCKWKASMLDRIS